MFILTVAPFIAIPRPQDQYLRYFSGEQIPPGSIVEILVRGKSTFALVYECRQAREARMELRTSTYALKKIERQITKHAVVRKEMAEFAHWLSEYYFTPLGLVLRRMIPRRKTMLKGLTLPKNVPPQTLTLVPEHILLSQYGGSLDTIFHSGLSEKEKGAIWQGVYEGTIHNVVGTRGAFFLPFSHLTDITIHHAESISHVSWDQNPHIDIRTAALQLKKVQNTRVRFYAQNPILVYPRSMQKRSAPAPMRGEGVLVDMREELAAKNYSILSRELQNIIQDKKSGKILLFINRKGFSSGVLCRDCGYIHMCKNCEIPYVYYAQEQILLCHHCGGKAQPPSVCPTCGGQRIKYMGTGTERVEEEITRLAPERTVVRMDGDRAPSEEKKNEIFTSFREGNADILIGTQLALKPELLPTIAYTGIVTMDPLLSLPDFRINERIYYMVDMLRAIAKKKCILQTYRPETPVFLQALRGDWKKFEEHEHAMRRALHWPPYSHIVKLAYNHSSAKSAEEEAQKLKTKLDLQIQHIGASNYVRILGPAPAFIPKVRGKYVWYMIIKWKIEGGEPKNLPLRNRLLEVVSRGWDIDVDPSDIV